MLEDVSSLQGQIRQLQMALAEEQRQRLLLQAQVQACVRRLNKLDPPESPLNAALRNLEHRGNVRVNRETGQITLLRRLEFQPRTTKDEPTAAFRDVGTAESICKDLAELSTIFRRDMTIEGHTKGGEGEFWQTVANGRARIVAETMIDFGANPNLLHTRGLPGRLGKNEVRTEVFMDLRNFKDEDAAVQEVDVVVNGRVVERDFIQGGRLLEREQDGPLPQGVRVIQTNAAVRPPSEERRIIRPSSPRSTPRTVVRSIGV